MVSKRLQGLWPLQVLLLLLPHIDTAGGSSETCASPVSLSARAAEGLAAALLADRLTFQGAKLEDISAKHLEELISLTEGRQSFFGEELLHALRFISLKGFEFKDFSEAWKGWATTVEPPGNPIPLGALEALQHLFKGVEPEAAASHYIDLHGAARAPALLLLIEQVDNEGLVLAGRELQSVTHENPKALQAGEFLLRAALGLLRLERRPCSHAERRGAMVAALRSGEEAGKQFHDLIDEVLAEAQSRDAVIAVVGAELSGSLASMHSDAEVLARLTSSGDIPGDEASGGKTSFIVPAIIWFAVAYDSLSEALLASARLGGDGLTLRAIFIGLLLGCRDGLSSDLALHNAGLPLSLSPFRRSGPLLRLCKAPGMCQGGQGKGVRRMHGVTAEAAVIQMAQAGSSGLHVYRVFVRLDANELLARLDAESAAREEQPADWNEEEDGAWMPPNRVSQVTCLARYFQFTTASGRHAPFGLWPAEAMCKLSEASPVWHDSFEVSLPEPLSLLIGGAVLSENKVDVKLPSLSVVKSDEGPAWLSLCRKVGLVKLPKGEWSFSGDSDFGGLE